MNLGGPTGLPEGGPFNVAFAAGGAAYFATHVKQLRALNPNTLLVSAGDMTGASPLASGSFDDEPTIEVMNAIGVDLNGVGNHEFDHGPSELLRLQSGGCNAADRVDAGNGLFVGSCAFDPTFSGASFEYLAANVDVASMKTIFPPYAIKTVGGARIAFVGMTLKATPTIVSASGTAGLTFTDEVDTVNALIPILKTKEKADAIVVLVHQGGSQQGTYNECVNFAAAAPAGTKNIADLVDMLDPAVDVVASAHTHQPYNCTRSGKLLTSAASFGRLITQIELTVDTGPHTVTKKRATNVPVTRDVTPDPTVQALIGKFVTDIAPIAERQVGTITADITRVAGPNGESALGDVSGDAFVAATGADIGVTNIGGLRDSLLYTQYYAEGDGVVTFEKAQAVMPFKNKPGIYSCTGAQIIAAIQQNVYVGPNGTTQVMQGSSNLTFTWNAANADVNGQGAANAATIALGGTPIDPVATYKVAMTTFLQGGGDGYTAWKGCLPLSTWGIDLDAFTKYLGTSSPLAPPTLTRITKL